MKLPLRKRTFRILIALSLAALLLGCSLSSDNPSLEPRCTYVPPSSATSFAEQIELCHGRGVWQSKQALRTRLAIWFGGTKRISGILTFLTNSSRSRIDLDDGTTLVFDGTHAWISPSSASIERARFHLLTWSYFVAAPMKLRDPGSTLALLSDRMLNNRAHPAARLTFSDGVGDSPDDWYIAYRQIDGSLLEALAYIVTYGNSVSEAEKKPHAITYSHYQEVDGVQIATEWKFWNWTMNSGTVGTPIGRGKLTHPEFIVPTPGLFDKPTDSKEDPLPR